jgi:hypothetical protein
MSAEVINLFPSQAEVDGAWGRYEALAREITDDPRRLIDREFMQRYWAAEDEAKRLFNARNRLG